MSDNTLRVKQKQELRHTGETTKPEKYFVPAVDIYETANEVVVRAEMPGVESASIDIGIENDVLTIEGQTAFGEPADCRVLQREFEGGRFQRKFTIAETIDREGVGAVYADGILTVTLPKIEPAKPRKIEVTMDKR